MLKRLVTGDTAPSGTVYDEDGRPVELAASWADGPTMLVFLRHFGCIFCREWMAEIERHHEEIKAAGIRQVVLLALGEPKHAAFFGPRLAPSAKSLAARSTEVYSDYGLRQGGLTELVGPRTVLSGLRAAAKGNRQGPATGDVRMLGATFIVDTNGVVEFAYYNRYAGDNPNLESLLDKPVTSPAMRRGLSHA